MKIGYIRISTQEQDNIRREGPMTALDIGQLIEHWWAHSAVVYI